MAGTGLKIPMSVITIIGIIIFTFGLMSPDMEVARTRVTVGGAMMVVGCTAGFIFKVVRFIVKVVKEIKIIVKKTPVYLCSQ
jgi:hypothetical protein